MIFFLYRVLMCVFTPFLYVLLMLRRVRGLEERGHVLEKTGRATLPRPAGKLVWLHAASVGEMLSIQPLVERILAANENTTCLITTVTVTSARLVRRRNNARILHQYMPLDHPVWVRRFMAHWKPDAVIWVESEIWPEALARIHVSDVPMMMVNGRMSQRSAKRWMLVRPVIATVFSWFDVMLAQTAQDTARLQDLGGDALSAGNIKFAAPALTVDAAMRDALQGQIGARPVLLFASTHAGEEEMAGKVAQTLAGSVPDALVMIMPRHPARGDDIRALLEGMNIRVAQRSRNETITPETQIYLADTLGEAGLFYALAGVAFVGNSLITVPGGGHNLLEPAHLDCAILHGPHMWNFPEIEVELRRAGGSITVADADMLAMEAARLFGDAAARQMLADNARAYVVAQNRVLDDVSDHLRPVLAGAGVQI